MFPSFLTFFPRLPLKQIPVPSLFIGATYDGALPPAMWVGQEAFVPNLTQRKVDTGHWAMVEDAEGVNAHLVEWVQGVVFGGKPKL